MNLDLEAMKAAALAATPGVWHAPGLAELHDESDRVIACFSDVDPVDEELRPEPSIEEGDRNATFVAAANPAAVLALIERLEGAESALASTIEKLRPTKGDVVVLRTSHNPGWAIKEQAKRIHDATGALVIVANGGCSVEMVESEAERAANAALTEENDRLQRRLDEAEAELRQARNAIRPWISSLDATRTA